MRLILFRNPIGCKIPHWKRLTLQFSLPVFSFIFMYFLASILSNTTATTVNSFSVIETVQMDIIAPIIRNKELSADKRENYIVSNNNSSLVLSHSYRETFSRPKSPIILYRLMFSSKIPVMTVQPVISSTEVLSNATDDIFKYPSLAAARKMYQLKNRTINSFETNDTLFTMGKHRLIDYPINSDLSVCSNDTFLLILIPIPKKDPALRDAFRSFIKQGMVVRNHTINYSFIIAVEEKDKMNYERIMLEKKKYMDIIISHHQDSRMNVSLSIFAGFLYAAIHCPEAQYVVKIDQDTFPYLGNMMRYLEKAPRTMCYGGKYNQFVPTRRSLAPREWYFPDDYFAPPRMIRYIDGPGVFISKDLVPIVAIGWQYEPVLSTADDVNIGAILNSIGIVKTYGRSFIMYLAPYPKFNASLIPNNYVYIHRAKPLQNFKALVAEKYPAAYY